MNATLIQVASAQHDELMRHLDDVPAVGDMVGKAAAGELRPAVASVATFLNDLLLPHMDAAERTLYPELERMLQNRHSMTPMRREHQEITRLVAEVVKLQERLLGTSLHTGDMVALRRVLFRLYALLKVHLAEEQLYVGIVEHGVSSESADRLAAALQRAGTVEL
ncbi:MAG: hemerythrin domain-containing protein [Chloroflexota bacterium]